MLKEIGNLVVTVRKIFIYDKRGIKLFGFTERISYFVGFVL
jgi:hypothetical protein